MENANSTPSKNSNTLMNSRTTIHKLRGEHLKQTNDEDKSQNTKSYLKSINGISSFQSFYPTFNNLHNIFITKNIKFLKKYQNFQRLKNYSLSKNGRILINKTNMNQRHLENHNDMEIDNDDSMKFFKIQRNKSSIDNYLYYSFVNNRIPRNKEKVNVSTISVIDSNYARSVHQTKKRKRTFQTQMPVSNLRKIVDKLMNLVKYKQSYIDQSQIYCLKNESKYCKEILPKINSERGKKKLVNNNIKISDISNLIKIHSLKKEKQQMPEKNKLIPLSNQIRFPLIENNKDNTRNNQSIIFPRNDYQQTNYFSTSIQVVVKKLK